MNSSLLLASALLLASVASANPQSSREQATFVAPAPGSKLGPNILIPTSNVRKTSDPRNKRFTQYLINVGPWNHPTLDDEISPLLALHGPAPTNPSGYHPNDIRSAYGMPPNGGAYAIAIIDANNDPYALSDFNTFSSTFGLPTETSTNATLATNKVLQVVYASGVQPPNDSGWSGEISLDIQWAHSIAPSAKIYLVEAAGATEPLLDQAVQVAASLPGVKEISMSYGSNGEAAGEQSEDGVYTQPGIVYYGATGDTGGERGYPALSPNVVAVGGTSVTISSGVVTSEQVWSSSGAGDSAYVPRPTFQNSVSGIVGSFRGSPDICATADPNLGVAFYDSYFKGGWVVAGGTSLACPVCAAIANVRLNYSSSSQVELTRLYGQLGGSFLRDITTGSIILNGQTLFKAGPGYDLASGLGEPVGLYKTQTRSTAAPSTVLNPLGRILGGSVSSLAAADGNTYSISSTYTTGVGEVAGTDVQFQVAVPAGSSVGAAQVNVTATTIFGATVEAYALNTTTLAYDDIGPVPTSVATSSGFVVLDPTKYIGTNGAVSLRFRAVRSLRYGFQTFAFRLDQAVVQVVTTS